MRSPSSASTRRWPDKKLDRRACNEQKGDYQKPAAGGRVLDVDETVLDKLRAYEVWLTSRAAQ